MKVFQQFLQFLTTLLPLSSILLSLILTPVFAGAANSGDVDLDNDGLIEIETLEELNQMRYNLFGTSLTDEYGDSNSEGCPASGCFGYELVNDLDFDTNGNGTLSDELSWNNGSGWVPIGTGRNSFSAVFEGNGHTIKNLYIRRSEDNNVGFFSVLVNATVRNLSLTGTLAKVYGNNDTGSLVGQIGNRNFQDSTVIKNVYSTISVIGKSDVGGLIGNITLWGSNTYVLNNRVEAVVQGSWYVGGLVGYVYSAMEDSFISIEHNSSNSFVYGQDNVGGLAGALLGQHGGYVKLTYGETEGRVTGNSKVGGLIGRLYTRGYTELNALDVSNSHANTRVIGRGNNIGGLIGMVEMYGEDGIVFIKIVKSYASSIVEGVNNVGGLIGQVRDDDDSFTIEDSYATGKVSGSDNVAGLIGYFYITKFSTVRVARTYALGSVRGSYQTGGLVSKITYHSSSLPSWYTDGYFRNIASYWNIETTRQTSSATGTGYTSEELKCPRFPGDSTCMARLYYGWSSSIWNFGTPTEYPTLR